MWYGFHKLIKYPFHPITNKQKFNQVEEGMDLRLHFPDGTRADGKTSYNDKYNKLRAEAANGWFELDPAYEYEGLKGDTSKGKMEQAGVYHPGRYLMRWATGKKASTQ
jgi:hypothetical protein